MVNRHATASPICALGCLCDATITAVAPKQLSATSLILSGLSAVNLHSQLLYHSTLSPCSTWIPQKSYIVKNSRAKQKRPRRALFNAARTYKPLPIAATSAAKSRVGFFSMPSPTTNIWKLFTDVLAALSIFSTVCSGSLTNSAQAR